MKKLCIILSVLIILGCIGYIAYDKITDFVVKKTLNMFAEDEALQEEISSAIQNLHVPESFVNPQETDGVSNQTSAPSINIDSKDEFPDKKTEGAIYPTAPSKTTSVPKQSAGSLSMDDLNAADKAYVMSIYSRFTASEVSTVSGMLSGGLTVDEKRAIKKIVYAKVSGAEINKLYEIANKYQ